MNEDDEYPTFWQMVAMTVLAAALAMCLGALVTGCGGVEDPSPAPASNHPHGSTIVGACSEDECWARRSLEDECIGRFDQPPLKKRCNDRCILILLTCTDEDPCSCP